MYAVEKKLNTWYIGARLINLVPGTEQKGERLAIPRLIDERWLVPGTDQVLIKV